MPSRSRHDVLGTLGCAVAIACWLGGCSSSGALFGQRSPSGSGASRSAEGAALIDSGALTIYLDALRTLIGADSLDQAARFNEIRDSAEFAPTTTNRLLYALALSVPGHPGFDPDEGVTRLQALIAAGDTLLPAERMLADIQLASASRFAILQAASNDFERRLEAELATRESAHETSLDALRAEIRRLEAELDDAAAMLDAITNIERSISERDDSDE